MLIASRMLAADVSTETVALAGLVAAVISAAGAVIVAWVKRTEVDRTSAVEAATDTLTTTMRELRAELERKAAEYERELVRLREQHAKDIARLERELEQCKTRCAELAEVRRKEDR